MQNIIVTHATEEDFSFIKERIRVFELDNRDLHYQQFVVAKLGNNILGFVRAREYKNCHEICSLGVLPQYRKMGVSGKLVNTLIAKITTPIFICSIIPKLFEKLGFEIVTVYPPEIIDKYNYCTSSLAVEEPYVVMRYNEQYT